MKWVRKMLRKRRHKRESFRARMAMERAAQENIAARLTRLDLAYRNKTRIK